MIFVLIRVAIITLIEQKIIRVIQIRVGPNKIGYIGLLQPFSDIIKLFFKETIYLINTSNSIIYLFIPIFNILLRLLLWILYPMYRGGYIFIYRIFWFLCIRRIRVFTIFFIGWASNCKYSLLGSLRNIAQIISYEIRLLIIIFRIIWCYNSLLLYDFILNQKYIINILLFILLGFIWLISSLAETNRNPFDFAEGESELVSGFNTEYRAGGFILIFIREYRRILFISILISILFFSYRFNLISIFFFFFFTFFFVWRRTRLPRFRYDKLIIIAWKRYLPVVLLLFIIYYYIKLKDKLIKLISSYLIYGNPLLNFKPMVIFY